MDDREGARAAAHHAALAAELAAPCASLSALRRLAWRGVPPALRPAVWRLLFGLAPTTAARREAALAARRASYAHVVAAHFAPGARRDEGVARQVVLDVGRTAPDVGLFRRPAVAEGLVRILYCAAIRRPAASYVQGMNDLAVPLYYVFFSERVHEEFPQAGASAPLSPVEDAHSTLRLSESALSAVEADTYWCLLALLDATQDTYTPGQAGVLRTAARIDAVVARARPALSSHLRALDVQPVQWALRWVSCVLLREFPLPVALRLWDAFLAADDSRSEHAGAGAFADFLPYACAALLGALEADLLACADFHDALFLLQHPPTAAWTERHVELLLAEAFLLRSLFRGSSA